MRKFVFLLCFSITASLATAQNMTNKKMEKILEAEAEAMEGKQGLWTVTYGEIPLLIITDERANRMRIFTFVTDEKSIEGKHVKKMLQANFHSALDAKYAMQDGYVVSIFTHPLKELSEDQFIDAMKQVVTLAYTFGTTYTSTEWVFGGGMEEETKELPKKKEKKL
ncbi:MAG: type III secretion system chaperone [Bacteroidota bacterium]